MVPLLETAQKSTSIDLGSKSFSSMKRVFVKGGKLAFPQGLSDLQLLKEIKKSCHLLHCLLCERVGCSDPNQADFEVGKTIFEELQGWESKLLLQRMSGGGGFDTIIIAKLQG